MGVFDWVIIDKPFDSLAVKAGEEFQTKSLEPCMRRYRISEEGTLLAGGRRIPFHGDMLLLRHSDEKPLELVARFTDGWLVGIWDIAEYPESLNQLLRRGP